MITITGQIMASFTAPVEITTNPQSLLWLIPLIASISIVYKATKLPAITPVNFIKETLLLSGSIFVFMAMTAAVLFGISWLFT